MAIPAARTEDSVTLPALPQRGLAPTGLLPLPPPDPTAPALPRYVRACKAEEWTVYVAWKDGRRVAIPYRCHSWRHEGPCRSWRAEENFARIAERLEEVEPRDVLLLVLTFDPRRLAAAIACVYLGAALRSAAGLWTEPLPEDVRFLAFGSLWRRWQSLRQSLHREAERRGERRARWGMTVEVHGSGWPHCNVMLDWPGLAERLREDRRLHRRRCTRTIRAQAAERCAQPGCLRNWLVDRATSAGFGRVLYLDQARDQRKLASYCLKLAGELELGAGTRPAGGARSRRARGPRLGASLAEVVKLSQLPVRAPAHFRRIRGSMRSKAAGVEAFMAPPHRNPDVACAALIFQRADVVGAAVSAGLDLVELGDAGELLPWPLARPPPASSTWLADALEVRRSDAARLSAQWARWYADNCPEIA